METITRTAVHSYVRDVGNAWLQVFQEIPAILARVPDLRSAFDLIDIQESVSIFALNEVIERLSLQFYRGDRLLCEFEYLILDGLGEGSSGSADLPSPGPFPSQTRVRIVATPNPRKPRAYCDAFFRRRGWIDADPLYLPHNATVIPCGFIGSGSYTIARTLRISPVVAGATGAAQRAKWEERI